VGAVKLNTGVVGYLPKREVANGYPTG